MGRSLDSEVLQLRWAGMAARNFRDLGNALVQRLYFGTLVRDDRDGSRTTRPSAYQAGGAQRAGPACFLL